MMKSATPPQQNQGTNARQQKRKNKKVQQTFYRLIRFSKPYRSIKKITTSPPT